MTAVKAHLDNLAAAATSADNSAKAAKKSAKLATASKPAAKTDAQLLKIARAELKAATARIDALTSELAECRGDVVTHIQTDSGLTRHQMPLGVKAHNHTPSAVDAIRLFTWNAKKLGMERKDIIASLISQKYTPTTVRARVSRIFAGTDESCFSEEIRARLGLDELDAEDEVNEQEETLSEENERRGHDDDGEEEGGE